MRTLRVVCIALLGLSAQQVIAEDHGWLQEQQSFRSAREESLRSPEGWMALVGLHWIEPGIHRVGSAEGNTLRLFVGPPELGTLEVLEGSKSVRLVLAPSVSIRIDAQVLESGTHELFADSSATPTRVDFEDGSLTVIQRGDKFGLRVRSPSSPAMLSYTGLNWFEPASAWSLEARFSAHPPGQTLPIVNVLGQVEATPNPGSLHFEIDGVAHRIEALGDPAESLFLVFGDRSNGRESYGAGRFLYTGPVKDGRVVLDFNRAINPPCAYTEFSTCPLPPPENRLPFAVPAGEARYRHGTVPPSS